MSNTCQIFSCKVKQIIFAHLLAKVCVQRSQYTAPLEQRGLHQTLMIIQEVGSHSAAPINHFLQSTQCAMRNSALLISRKVITGFH